MYRDEDNNLRLSHNSNSKFDYYIKLINGKWYYKQYPSTSWYVFYVNSDSDHQAYVKLTSRYKHFIREEKFKRILNEVETKVLK